MSISKNVPNIVQITFHLSLKIRSKSFPKTFKLLRTEHALVHKPFVQNADSAVIFIDRCPEICILKAGKLPLNFSRSRGSNFQWELFLPDRCVLLGIWGLRVGPSGLHRQTYVEAPKCSSSSTRTPHFAQTAHGCALKKDATQDRFVEVRRIQQFLKLRLSKN